MKISKILVYFCGYGLLINSIIKFLAFRVPATRLAGLVLVSAYLGAAVAAHLAEHPAAIGGPFIQFMSGHPIVGACYPGVFLMAAWVGMWLQRRGRGL